MTDSGVGVTRFVRIRFFAAARQRAGTDVVEVPLPTGARFTELREAISERVPTLRPMARHLLFAVGTEYATDDSLVPDGREIVAFPPVSGG